MTTDTTAARPRAAPLLCNCQRTMTVDGERIARALGVGGAPPVHTELCRAQLSSFEGAIARAATSGAPLTVACTQEAPLFREVAAEKLGEAGQELLRFVNIRETAGWTADKASPLAKMAALIALAAHEPRPAGQMTLASTGQCLIYGRGEVAMAVARKLAGRLAVTLLLTEADDAMLPPVADFSVYKGRIRHLAGHLGAFDLEVDGYAPLLPSSRDALQFVMARDGARTRCDIVLDLTGGTSLVGAARKRPGYLRADPASPVAVAEALFEATDLVGEFDKPLYVTYDAAICAHARSQKVGCRNCLDVCPLGAIAPDGDHVRVDPAICGGCGACSAACPTGAVSYAYARREDLVARTQILLAAYRGAGGKRPILLLHDQAHGEPLIAALARHGTGLAANVLPLGLFSVHQLGHDALLAMLAGGAERVVVLASPEEADELPALERQRDLVAAFTGPLGYGAERVVLLSEADPDAVGAALAGLSPLADMPATAFAAEGSKRDIARVALGRLNEAAPRRAELIALPAGSPYGRIRIDVAGCTLCLSCVSACPAGALADNPDRPEVAFTEQACVQCGVCVATCPERVITLEPRYDFTSAAMSPVVLKSEEPALCKRCGKAFGTRATIDKVLARLQGHAMFADEKRRALIQMCDDCRIIAASEDGGDPFQGAARPRPMTTEDYLEAEAKAKASGRKPEDFLSLGAGLEAWAEVALMGVFRLS